MPNYYILLFSRLYYHVLRHTMPSSQYTRLQIISFLLALGQTVITLAIINLLNIVVAFNILSLKIAVIVLFLISFFSHLIFFTVNKKYLRIFFYSNWVGPHVFDLIICALIAASFLSTIYLLKL